jgi:hypothetical protein
MKHFIGLMERIAVSGGAGLALPFQDRLQRQYLARCRALRGKPRGGFLQRLADDDGFRERCDRNARDEDAGLGIDLQQALIR